MTDSINTGDALFGVDCGVVNCKYHGNNDRCCANSISVESHEATKKAETFCGTFAPRSMGS